MQRKVKEMNKKQKSLIAVYAITLVVYSVMFFAIPIPKIPASWMSYVFSVLSIGIAFAVTNNAFGKNDSLTSKFYGFPVFKVGNVYCLIQVLFGAVITIIGAFVEVPMWIVVVISIVLLGIAMIGLIGTAVAKDVVEKQEDKIARQTQTMKIFKLDIENVVSACTNYELKKRLENLSEKFKYSDPVSNVELEEIENKLKAEIEMLSELVVTDEKAALEKIVFIENLLADRNRRCKAMKR